MHIFNKPGDLIRNGILIVVIPWTFIAVLFYFVAVTFVHNRELKSKYMRLNREIIEMRKIAGQFSEHKKIFVSADKRLSVILNDISSAAIAAKIKLDEVRIGDEVKREDYYILPISIVIKGSYNQIGKFINWIELKNDRLHFIQIRLDKKKGKIICELKGEFVIL